MAVQNEKLIKGLFGFIGASLGILLLPFGLLDWGRKNAKARKASRGNGVAKKTAPKPTPKTTASRPKKTPAQTARKRTSNSPSLATAKATVMNTATKPTVSTNTILSHLFENSEPKATAPVVEAPTAIEPDENTPKSTPKNENDQYIRKRMIIAGSYYCDKTVLDTLEVGSHVDLEAEPNNPYDQDAVKLLFNGQKIGYVGKSDRLAFATCLKLKRKIYGVITAIIEEDSQTKYEYETWFDNAR